MKQSLRIMRKDSVELRSLNEAELMGEFAFRHGFTEPGHSKIHALLVAVGLVAKSLEDKVTARLDGICWVITK